MAVSTSVRGLVACLGFGFFVAFVVFFASRLGAAPRLPEIERGSHIQAEPAQTRRSARRKRAREQKKRESEAPADAPATNITPPQQPRGAKPDPQSPPAPDTKPGAVPAPPADGAVEPKNIWTDQEIIAALQDCVRALGPSAAEVEPAPPLRAGQCGAAAPVMLRRAGSVPGVEIRPPAMVNCAMAARLSQWVDTVLQPAARETLGSPIAAIAGFSGYDCRFRNNAPSGKLSEHAYANALDIAGFVTANKRKIGVLGAWGPTRRDLEAKASAEAAAKAKLEADAKGKEDPPADARPEEEKAEDEDLSPRERRAREKKERGKRIVEAPKEAGPLAKDARQGKKPRERGRARDAAGLEPPAERIPAKPAAGKTKRGRAPPDAQAPPDLPAPEAQSGADPAKPTPERQFLSRVHDGACGIFTTVLGPEANEAHRNHFHFDLAPRKRAAFCQ